MESRRGLDLLLLASEGRLANADESGHSSHEAGPRPCYVPAGSRRTRPRLQ